MGVEYPDAVDAFIDENRTFINQNSHYAIVIHKTACNGRCSAQSVRDYFATDKDMPSTHFIVDKDGTVVQCVHLKDGAGGNGRVEPGYDPFWQQFVTATINLNTVTISIEHVDYSSDNSDTVPIAQRDASFNLVKWLCEKYSIPADRVKTHASIDPQSRSRCPGNYPFDELLSFIRGGGIVIDGTTGLPTGWTDDGTTLRGPNEIPVVLGFREYILTHQWDPEDVALGPEYHAELLAESAPNLGAGQKQYFELGTVLVYTSHVFKLGAGVELAFIKADRDNLRKQVADLSGKLSLCTAGLPRDLINQGLTDLEKLVSTLKGMTGG